MAIKITNRKSRLPTQNSNSVVYRNLTTILQVNTNAKERIFDTDYYVEGYATTFNQPYVLYEYDDHTVYEVVEKTALTNADMQDVIFQYNHRGRVFARQSNNTLALIVDDKGLKIAADLSRTDLAKSLYQDIKEKMITKMSWGFTTTAEGYYYDREVKMWVVKEVKKVYDVSAVDLPADKDTEIEARRKEMLLNNNRERHIKIIDMLARI